MHLIGKMRDYDPQDASRLGDSPGSEPSLQRNRGYRPNG